MLLANPIGFVVDQIFALPASELGAATAWLGIVCYALQIYFDFSGYSDMADRPRPHVRLYAARELPPAVHRRVDPRLLAALAHVPLYVVP